MHLTVQTEAGRATLLRAETKLGELALDELWQVGGIVIDPAATPEEDELIIRLAASHVAQFVAAPRTYVLYGVVKGTYPPLPGCTPERSRELLDFERIASEHGSIPTDALESMMGQLGIAIDRAA